MKYGGLILLLCCAHLIAVGQQLTVSDKKVLEAARSRYYNLEQRGLLSFQCAVLFDLSTIPSQLLPQDDIADRKLLRATSFKVKYERQGPTVSHSFPDGTSAIAQAQEANLVNWMTSIVNGFILTWPTKGFQGPIPPFDSEIENISMTPDGYHLTLAVSGGPVEVTMDKGYLVTRIESIHGQVEELPTFSETSEGLVYSGTHTINESPQGERSDIRVDITSGDVDGLQLPQSIRLRVNDDVDVTFGLSECSVTKASVVSVAPPKNK